MYKIVVLRPLRTGARLAVGCELDRIDHEERTTFDGARGWQLGTLNVARICESTAVGIILEEGPSILTCNSEAASLVMRVRLVEDVPKPAAVAVTVILKDDHAACSDAAGIVNDEEVWEATREAKLDAAVPKVDGETSLMYSSVHENVREKAPVPKVAEASMKISAQGATVAGATRIILGAGLWIGKETVCVLFPHT